MLHFFRQYRNFVCFSMTRKILLVPFSWIFLRIIKVYFLRVVESGLINYISLLLKTILVYFFMLTNICFFSLFLWIIWLEKLGKSSFFERLFSNNDYLSFLYFFNISNLACSPPIFCYYLISFYKNRSLLLYMWYQI